MGELLSKPHGAAVKVIPNQKVQIAKGCGILIIQEAFHTVELGVFVISAKKVTALHDPFRSIQRISVEGDNVFWTEPIAGVQFIRMYSMLSENFTIS